MADRSQNITINYKFNTAEIEKANAILNRANTATNQLQAAGQKAGQQLSSSYSQAGKSIGQMQIELARLKTQIEVSSNPRRVAELSNQYKVLKAQIDAANKSAFQTPKAMKETAVATQSLASQFGNLYTAAKLIVTAGIVKEVVSIGIEMAKLSGNVEGVQRAFNNAFPDAENLLFNLRRSTKGAISDFDLMKQSLQAANFGLPVEKLGKLLEFATAKAQQTGLSIDYITDSLVTGLGRNSERVFDNLQLDIAELRKRIASGLDFRTAGIQLIEEDLNRMGGAFETSATKADQLTASTSKLIQELGKLATQDGGFIDFLKDYADTAGLLIEAINRGISVSELSNEQRVKEIANISANEFATRVLTGSKEENVKAIEDEIAALTKELGVYADQRESVDKTIASFKSLLTGYLNEDIQIKKNIQTQKDWLAPKTENALIDQEILKILQAKLEALDKVDAKEKQVSSGIVERKKKEIEAIQEEINSTNKLSDLSVGGRLTKSLEIAQAELADLLRVFSEFKIDPFKIEVKDATKDIDALGDAMDRATARIEEGLQKLAEQKPVITPATLGYTDTFWDELGDALKDNLGQIVSQGTDIVAEQLTATREIELQSMKLRLNDLKKFFDDQIELAGNNEQAKRALRKREEKETAELNRKIFEKEKQTRRSQAIIDGAAGVVKAFATYPWPVALIISGLLTAKTLSQLSIINKQKSGFAKGVIDLKGPGTGTSDSIPANLSRGESVMTAWETRHAGDVLKDIRAKKLDNKVLKNLKQGREPIVSQQQFNDEKIIKAIEKNRPPDVVEQSGIVYKVTQRGETYRNKVRAKSVRL